MRKHRVSTKTSKHQSVHHVIPKSRSGKSTQANLTKKDIDRHQAFHLLYGNSTPVEVIRELLNEWFNMADWDRDARVQEFCDLVVSVTESKERMFR